MCQSAMCWEGTLKCTIISYAHMLHTVKQGRNDRYHRFPPVDIRFRNKILSLKFAPNNVVAKASETKSLRALR